MSILVPQLSNQSGGKVKDMPASLLIALLLDNSKFFL